MPAAKVKLVLSTMDNKQILISARFASKCMADGALQRIGLSDDEVRVYRLLLRKGSSKATALSSELGTARTTVYRLLEGLRDKGLAGESVQEGVKFFNAVSPERIPEIMEERLEEVRGEVAALKSLQGKNFEEARTELYRGKEGIKTVMRDVLREGKPYTFIGEAEKYFSEVGVFVLQWLRKVEKNGLRGRLLCPKGQKFKVAKTEERRFLPDELISGISTWTYGNKTALFIWSEPFYVVLIANEFVTNSNRKSFEYLWKQAKR